MTCVVNAFRAKQLCDELIERVTEPQLKKNRVDVTNIIKEIIGEPSSANRLTLTGESFIKCKKFLIEEQICFEVNITSNYTLVSDLHCMQVGSANGRRRAHSRTVPRVAKEDRTGPRFRPCRE